MCGWCQDADTIAATQAPGARQLSLPMPYAAGTDAAQRAQGKLEQDPNPYGRVHFDFL